MDQKICTVISNCLHLLVATKIKTTLMRNLTLFLFQGGHFGCPCRCGVLSPPHLHPLPPSLRHQPHSQLPLARAHPRRGCRPTGATPILSTHSPTPTITHSPTPAITHSPTPTITVLQVARASQSRPFWYPGNNQSEYRRRSHSKLPKFRLTTLPILDPTHKSEMKTDIETLILFDFFFFFSGDLQILLARDGWLPSLLVRVAELKQKQSQDQESEERLLTFHLCQILSHCVCQPQALRKFMLPLHLRGQTCKHG